MAVRPSSQFAPIAQVRDFLIWRLSIPPRPILIVMLTLCGMVVLWDHVPEVRRFFVPVVHYGAIAPLFTAQVVHWEQDIQRWATEYDIDPNLLATVMQIESCGHPTVSSPAGAQGLFQVMPFHFETDEDMLDPDTNAKRGAAFLKSCLGWADGHVGLALACYNGGPGVIQQNTAYWYPEVQRYYYWGTIIYADALANRSESERLTEWLNAGGVNLCRRATAVTGAG